MGARKAQLIENGLIAAEETVLEHFTVAIGVGYGVTDMKNLAVVAHVRVVAVAFTSKIGRNIADDQLGPVR